MTKIKMKQIKQLSILLLPLLIFGIIAASIGAHWQTLFENEIYEESVEHLSPTLTFIVKGITHLGDTVSVCVITLSLYVIPKIRKRYAIPVSIGVILSTVINILLKNYFARPRPEIFQIIAETGYSFPSGHAMINATLYTIVMMIAWGEKKRIIPLLCAFMIGLIGFSRIYLGVHYATDVVAGWACGVAVALAVYFVFKLIVNDRGAVRYPIKKVL